MIKNLSPENWKVRKIGVIGPGIVGMPMAGMLAHAEIRLNVDTPARVVVVQRNSANSGWKVDTINKGHSVIGGIEPELDSITGKAWKKGLISATHDFMELSDADVILVSVQTDKKGFEPDYGPLFGALEKLAEALQKKPAENIPLVIFESTLAPTTMDTLIRDHFAKYGLVEGKNILLGNSPNRVMPGRLVERVRSSDKLAGGLSPVTPELIEKLYSHIVTEGKIYKTNSLTAEVVKTLENAYRDVRIAFSAEIVRYCDEHDVDFYQLREKVNEMLAQTDLASLDPNAVPKGGILIPMLGVGGHCLPKDGILLWWRSIASGTDTSSSIIMNARIINDESPLLTLLQAEKAFGSLKNEKIALLGAAYRFNSEDTRNSPTLSLAGILAEKGYRFTIHDPFVHSDDQNLTRLQLQKHFSNDLDEALKGAAYVFLCTAHKEYIDRKQEIFSAGSLKGIMDASNIYKRPEMESQGIPFEGIGRGRRKPAEAFIRFTYDSFRILESSLAWELLQLIDFYNKNYANDEYNKVDFKTVQKLARTCSTGCDIADPLKPGTIPSWNGFKPRIIHFIKSAG